MTLFLASVRDPIEAELVLAAGADIVDLKEPARGALGAAAPDVIGACIEKVRGRSRVSATVGDLPMVPDTVVQAVSDMARLGVDDVKLGISPGGDPQSCFARLGALDLTARLILVVFADAMPAFEPVAAARVAGASGVMLDTAGKGEGSLTDHMTLGAIGDFVERARRAGLTAGVAGSLRASHIPPLLAVEPDVIGFRGALCNGGLRNQNVDPEACRRVRRLIPSGTTLDGACFGEPRAPALC